MQYVFHLLHPLQSYNVFPLSPPFSQTDCCILLFRLAKKAGQDLLLHSPLLVTQGIRLMRLGCSNSPPLPPPLRSPKVNASIWLFCATPPWPNGMRPGPPIIIPRGPQHQWVDSHHDLQGNGVGCPVSQFPGVPCLRFCSEPGNGLHTTRFQTPRQVDNS